jgi:Arc/MetJ-type ribon-helix-helix transcriptional regulator
MEKENLAELHVRIPRNLKDLMKEYVQLDAHKDISELTRDALREKIKRDAPRLYKKLFEEKETEA